MKVRLNKYLASCGLGSRRKVEEYILSGKIKINNKTSKKLALFIDPEIDLVEYNNKRIKPAVNFHYIILNKPKGYITTLSDELGRPTVMDLIPEKFRKEGIFPVGRLDMDTEGLLLLTNDGTLANRLSHPRYSIDKKYLVEINRPLEEGDLKKITKGIFLPQIGSRTGKAGIEIINDPGTKILITLREGKKRQIRYTFIKLGYKIKYLKRIGYASLSVRGIKRGSFRLLKENEIKILKKQFQE